MSPLLHEATSWQIAFTVGLFVIAFIMAARMGRWFLLQTAVFVAVMCAGIYFKWTIGGYATSMLAVFAAFIVTRAVAAAVVAIDLMRSWLRHDRLQSSPQEETTQEQLAVNSRLLARD